MIILTFKPSFKRSDTAICHFPWIMLSTLVKIILRSIKRAQTKALGFFNTFPQSAL